MKRKLWGWQFTNIAVCKCGIVIVYYAVLLVCSWTDGFVKRACSFNCKLETDVNVFNYSLVDRLMLLNLSKYLSCRQFWNTSLCRTRSSAGCCVRPCCWRVGNWCAIISSTEWKFAVLRHQGPASEFCIIWLLQCMNMLQYCVIFPRFQLHFCVFLMKYNPTTNFMQGAVLVSVSVPCSCLSRVVCLSSCLRPLSP